MNKELTVVPNLDNFLRDYLYPNDTDEQIQEMIDKFPILIRTMAFELRERMQNDPAISAESKTELSKYSFE